MSYPVSTWNISDIITKMRAITGTPSTLQLSDEKMADYANRYYAFTMPFELKEQVNQQPINFSTVANQDAYPMPSGFQTDEPMAYANGYPLVFYQDRDIFFQDWPQQYTQDQVATGAGLTTIANFSTQAFPIIAGTFTITDGTAGNTMFDTPASPFDGTGTLASSAGTGSGSINYTTGAVTSVTFPNAVTVGTLIYDNYQAYQPARPQGVLFYNSTLTFRPIPDQVYNITLQGFITQVQLDVDTGTTTTPIFPLQTEWGELIALGASLEIFMDRGDLGAYNTYYPIFKRYENVALGRFVEQFTNSQSVPRF